MAILSESNVLLPRYEWKSFFVGFKTSSMAFAAIFDHFGGYFTSFGHIVVNTGRKVFRMF